MIHKRNYIQKQSLWSILNQNVKKKSWVSSFKSQKARSSAQPRWLLLTQTFPDMVISKQKTGVNPNFLYWQCNSNGNLALLAGWGKESENGNREKLTLRRIPLAIFSQETCHSKYDLTGSSDDAKSRAKFLPNMFTNQTICAGSYVSLWTFFYFSQIH